MINDIMKGKSSINLKELGVDTEAFFEFDLLVEGLFKILNEELGFVFPAVAMFDENVAGLRVVKYRYPSKVPPLIKKFAGGKVEDLVFPMDQQDNLFIKAYKEQKIFLTDSAKLLAAPHFFPKALKLFDNIAKVKMWAIVPVVKDGKSVGGFKFGSRIQTDLSSEERIFLLDLGKQIAIYLERTWKNKNELQSIKDSKEKLVTALQINQDFLLQMGDLLQGLTDEFGISVDNREDISDALKYLKSLYLISSPYTKEEE